MGDNVGHGHLISIPAPGPSTVSSPTPAAGLNAPVSSSAPLERAGCVSLPRYAQLVGLRECGLFGVKATAPRGACTDVWTKAARDSLAHYLDEAQTRIEALLGYYLCPTYTLAEEHPWTPAGRVSTRWARAIAAGVRAEADVALGLALNHAADPATFGPVATTVTDASELHFYLPGTATEVTPGTVTISGGLLSGTIPRCRLVAPAVADNPEAGLTYTDLANFVATIDVGRVYTDPATQGVLVWPHRCGATCAATGCSEYTQTACAYPFNLERGTFDLRPATYAAGAWTAAALACASRCSGPPEIVRLSYLSGLTESDPLLEAAVIRLAHTLMPDEPCGCEQAQRVWQRDRLVPEVLTAERLNCPFGLMDGAWLAYVWASGRRRVRALDVATGRRGGL